MTLTGVGGVGKTRLALEVGERLIDDFADGVWLTALAAVGDPPRCPTPSRPCSGSNSNPA